MAPSNPERGVGNVDIPAKFTREELILAFRLVHDEDAAGAHADAIVRIWSQSNVGSGITLDTLVLLALAAEEFGRKVREVAGPLSSDLDARVEEMRRALKSARKDP